MKDKKELLERRAKNAKKKCEKNFEENKKSLFKKIEGPSPFLLEK